LVAAVNFYYNPNIGELVDGRELQDAYGLLSDVLGKVRFLFDWEDVSFVSYESRLEF
jgi:hypothetical protein